MGLAVACFTFPPAAKNSYPIVIPVLFCLAFSRDSGGQTRVLYHKTAGLCKTCGKAHVYVIHSVFGEMKHNQMSNNFTVFSTWIKMSGAGWYCETGAGSANRAIRHQSPPRWQVFRTTFVRVRWAELKTTPFRLFDSFSCQMQGWVGVGNLGTILK